MLENGTRIAGYEIEGVLGHGGMGVVYEARQLALNRKVALKILSGTLGMDPSFKERFRNEGRIQAAIDHPHIVTVFEAGEWEDSLFIAMRLVRGPNLKEMIIARELEGARTLRILRPIAEALDAAHEAGLIHRDIKPQNILVGARDRAYLADFGLTKGIDDAGLTQTGQFVGTIDYIAPEQIRGEQATRACDIYALSAVLYECLTGTVPYPKPSDAAVMYAHLSEPPPLVSEARPELPPNLDEVICKAMDKDASARYASASALIEEAEQALGKRVRAVITPPGPIERPEETGIREREARVPTRPERLRQPSTARPAPAPTLPATVVPAESTPPVVAHAPPLAPPAEPEQSAPAPAPPTIAAPAVEREQSAPAPAPPTVAAPAVEREQNAAAAPATVVTPSVKTEEDAPPTVDAPPAEREESGPEPPPPSAEAPPAEREESGPEPMPPSVEAPLAQREQSAPAPAPPTVVAPAVEGDERAPALPTQAGATVEHRESAPTATAPPEAVNSPAAPPTVALPAAERGKSSRRHPQPAPAAASSASPERAARRERSASFPFVVAAVTLVVAALVGYLVGKPGDAKSPAPASSSDSALTSSITAGALALNFPKSWERRGEAPKIPGLVLADQVVLGPAGKSDRGVVAGMAADAGGPRLLGPGFLAGLPKAPRPADRVRLGKVEALRYEGLRPDGFGGRALTVFAAPTSAGVATIACFAPPGGGAAFRSDCERVAGTLQIKGATAFPVGADKRYGTALSGVVTQLATRRSAGRTALAKARTPAAQSKAAAGLAAAYARARADLAKLKPSPAAAPAQAGIEQALGKAAAAYQRLGRARRPAAFRRATTAVKRAERTVQARLADLKPLGYAAG